MSQGSGDPFEGERDGGGEPSSPYVRETFDLTSSHRWKAAPGYSILVIDAGAVRFEYPQGWHVVPKARQLNLHDRLPPDDEGRFQVTVFRLSPLESGSWDALPLDQLLSDAVAEGRKRKKRAGRKGAAAPASTRVHDVTSVRRPDLEYVWTEYSGPDPENGRLVFTRQLMARARGAQPLITFDYYASRAEDYRPVWQHMVDSLRLGSPVSLLGDPSN